MQSGGSAWIPTVIALGSITLLFFLFRKMINEGSKNVDKQIKEVKEQLEKDEEKIWEKHALICENSFLKVKEIINGEMNKFKDDFFDQIRKLKKDLTTVVKNNGRKRDGSD